MHPNVYKKQHQPLRSVLQFFIFMMILWPATTIHSCNYAVKKVRINSQISKGYLRIEENKVVASQCKQGVNCNNSYDLYTVTIDKHYILLFHIKTGKFICWNKSFTRLIVKKNPTNLTYCKFEEKPSLTHPGSHIRYTTNHNGREVEIRINKNGHFATPRQVRKCLNNKVGNRTPSSWRDLDPTRSMEDKEAYHKMVGKCLNPNFLPKLPTDCQFSLPEFCNEMKIRKKRGHKIATELMDLCKRVE